MSDDVTASKPAVSPEVLSFWQSFCEAKGISKDTPFQAFYFGMDQALADELAVLVARGQKRATTSLLQTNQEHPEDAPKLDGYCVVTTFTGAPVAVIRTIALHVFRFCDVPAWFAEREGEDEGVGEVCLASWKAGHARYFTRYLASLDRVFDEAMEVECECFDVLQVLPAFAATLAIPSSVPVTSTTANLTITCDGFTLRPLQLSDAVAIAKHANDVDVWRNLFDGFPHPYTLAHAQAWCGTESHSGDFGFVWGIMVDGEAIGCIGVRPESGAARCSAETGYWLGKAHWGKGIAASALKVTTEWAWANLPEIERLFAPVYARNPASQRVAQKAGYVLEAHIPRSMVKAGEVIDVMQYAAYRQ